MIQISEVAQLTPESSGTQVATPACTQNQVLFLVYSADQLNVVTQGIKPEIACCCHPPGAVHFSRQFQAWGIPCIILQAYGITSGSFGIIHLKIRVGVKDIIGIPYNGLSPVNSLPAGAYFQVAKGELKPEAVDGWSECITGTIPQIAAA